jgi:predicted NBD/HSP70 family sugar kinase/transcriptional regulator with XRE-family HTH domain
VATKGSRLGDPDQPDDLDRLLDEVGRDPRARAAWEDAHERDAVRSALILAREDAHLSQATVAASMGTTQSAVSDIESRRVDPRLSSLQRYARAVGHVLRIMLDGEEITAPAAKRTENDDLDQLLPEVSADPVAAGAREDAQRRTAVVTALVAARRRKKLNQRKIADALGTTQSVVSELESGRIDPKFSTLQRYARVTGQLLGAAAVDQKNGMQPVTASLLPETRRVSADPVLVEAARLTASVGIEDVLRDLLLEANRTAGMTVQRLLSPTRVSPSTKRRTLRALAFNGWFVRPQGIPEDAAAWTLNPTAAHFIGISVREDHVRGAVASLGSPERALDIDHITLTGTTPTEVINAIEQLVDLLSARNRQTAWGVGIELSGPVNGTNGTVLFAPDLQRDTNAVWRDFDLEEEVATRIGVRTVVENDARALATYEWLLTGTPGGLVVVNLSESNRGIGAGLVFNGGLIRGIDGESGEIGHVIVDPDGMLCTRCGRNRHGCLETVASGEAVATALGAVTLADAAAQVVRRPESGVEFEKAGRHLGQVLGDLTTMLDPEQIVIYGPAELVDDVEQRSAQCYLQGLFSGLTRQDLGKAGSPRFAVHAPETGPLAAASVAMNSFVSHALDWTPEMSLRPGDQPAAAS